MGARNHKRLFGVVGRTWLLVSASALAFFVLIEDNLGHANPVSLALACLTFLGVIAGTFVSIREHARLAEDAHTLAETDSLTGLKNRRKLFGDLESALATSEEHLLVLFDLNGFKRYNDTYGHPAGDAFLTRLATKLEDAAGSEATCYRLGGDEFCVLAPTHAGDFEALIEATTAALTDSSEGFSVSTSFGCAFLPGEAADPIEALRVADERLYAQKHAARVAHGKPYGAVLKTLYEAEPAPESQVGGVAELSRGVAAALHLTGADLDDLDVAAGLHDIGKLAIPDDTLLKSGPLNAEEWAFIRRHTLIGERLVSASPALGKVGRIVRSTHERWDGSGYPDALPGSEIPLAARIIAVCNAYAAMTTARPYRAAIEPEAAIKELQRCAGSQFDPDVVDAFVAAQANLADEALMIGATA